jgi:2,5-diketo-D-gluconate reductase B
MNHISLASGYKIPSNGLGTWMLKGNKCKKVIKKALRMGYRHIDTAYVYGNEKVIGEAIKESRIDRGQLFITSKVWRDDLMHDDLISQFNESLEDLGLDYIDLYLVHWPNKEIPMRNTFKALKELVDVEKIRSIGVSNFTINHLKDAMEVSEVPISVNQVEFHPYLYQKELLEFCKQNGIVVTAYSPLGHGEVLTDPILEKIGKKHGRSSAQVTLRWLFQKNIVAIPKSVTEKYLKQNFNIFNFKLDLKDVEMIDSLNKDHRTCDFGFSEFNY